MVRALQRSHAFGRMARERSIAIDISFASSIGSGRLRRFLQTIVQGCAIVRFLSSDSLIGGTSALDRPWMGDRSQEQNTTSHKID
jgi:protein gp37